MSLSKKAVSENQINIMHIKNDSQQELEKFAHVLKQKKIASIFVIFMEVFFPLKKMLSIFFSAMLPLMSLFTKSNNLLLIEDFLSDDSSFEQLKKVLEKEEQ